MRLTPKLLTPLTAKKLNLTQQQQQPSQLIFVDVDPALAEPTPPKAPKFYSANNSVAANPTPQEELVPEIRGHQDKVMKTTPDTSPQTQAACTVPAHQGNTTRPKQSHCRKRPVRPATLVMAKPLDETPQEKDGKVGCRTGTEQRNATGPSTPAHHRGRHGPTRNAGREIPPGRRVNRLKWILRSTR